jgi:hypothetical protein
MEAARGQHPYGVCYSPTWASWTGGYSNTGPDAQFSDSDFFNVSFQALWANGSDGTNQYRNDVGAIGQTGFNLVRLYDWNPVRGWNGSMGTDHQTFLQAAIAANVQIIVPVSNYYLSDDTYAWNLQNPDSAYSFDSAPTDIQAAFNNFITSVTDPTTGELFSSVHSFAVGNEIDLNTFQGQGNPDSPPVDPAYRLARVLWWIVNLQAKLAGGFGKALLTSPISNGDQGGSSETNPPSYWFQAFVNGVAANTTPLPNGTVGGSGTFATTWPGLNTFAWYTDGYYNSVNIYQYGTGLTGTIQQYDAWTSTGLNSTNWPGQQFTVPLMLSEIGYARTTQDAQFQGIISDICTPVATYVASNPATLLMGYCLFEWNDEPGVSATLWGLQMLGNVLYSEPTGTTNVGYATWPSVNYPVTALSPVTSGGVSLLSALNTIFDG